MKRNDYLDWEDYFMAVAFLAAKRSKDPCTQVGACIVNDDNIIIGIGYNGFPKGCSDDKYPWTKGSPNPLENKHFYVCHAELNAVLNKNTSDTKGCRMYVALFPCNECAKVIIQSGIKEVIYMSNKNFEKKEVKAATKMFEDAGVLCRAFIPKEKVIVINFDDINQKRKTHCKFSPSKKKRGNCENPEPESSEYEANKRSDDTKNNID